MDFFEHQELARRNTRRLVVLMTLAVLTIIALTTVVFVVASVGLTSVQTVGGGGYWRRLLEQVGWQPIAWISLLVGLLVLVGSGFKWFQLRPGGQAVAEALGGQLIPGNSQELPQRKLLNIVEEMAIASGMPVPPVYELNESGINAFAAGHGPHDAVIGVTRGAMEQLSRDELQGVIAHEFSHILHGDMRLNLRLVAVLNGLLLIGLLGHILARSGARRGLRRRSNQGNVALIGLGLIILGAVGTFFGNWIKAAVSRQREFLADASAVQYTRNPEGIGGALIKIGHSPDGSRLSDSDANEFSHMYFEEGVKARLSGLMATHPPLEDRIRRVLPGWQGDFTPLNQPDSPAAAQTSASDSTTGREETARSIAAAVAVASSAGHHTGEISPKAIEQAKATLETLPQTLREAARDPFSARGLLWGLQLNADANSRASEWSYLAEQLKETELNALRPVMTQSAELPDGLRLPAIELALPSLNEFSDQQRRDFLAILSGLAKADGRVQLSEWIVYRLAHTHLVAPVPKRQRLKLAYCQAEARLLLSVAAWAGRTQPAQAYRAGASRLGLESTLMPTEDIGFTGLDSALDRLRQLRPLEKPELLKALRECLLQDQRVTPREAELYRAVADALDCPTPPLEA